MFQFNTRQQWAIPVSLLSIALVTASCGDREIKTGHILDSALEGLDWTTGSMSGVTGSDGSFEYRKGDNVTFSLGSISLGSAAKAQGNLTILALVEGATSVTNNAVTNMARLLQTLDNDEDLTNGITITNEVKSRS